MEAVFLKLLNMSITASWLVLAVALLRLLLKKAPRALLCSLWAVVALRLLCPVSLESALSLIPRAEPVSTEIFYFSGSPHPMPPRVPVQTDPLPVIPTESSAVEAGLSAADTAFSSSRSLLFYASAVWLAGMVLMIAYALFSYLRIRKRVGPSVSIGNGVFLCDHIDTPFILGLFRPGIYLPSSLSNPDADFVLAHERCHLKRRDHWWKPLGFLLLSVYWFNPVLWLGYILLCRDIELACDEKVIRDMDAPAKKAYSTALLNCSIPKRMISACPLAFGEVGIKTRIRHVLHYKKPAFWVLVLTVVLSALFCVCFLTDPAGIPLSQIDDSRNYSDLLTNTENITLIQDGERRMATDASAVLDVLEKITVREFTFLRTRSETRDKTNQIQLRKGTFLNFSRDYTRVWIDNGLKPTYTYRVLEPDLVRGLFTRLFQQKEPQAQFWFDLHQPPYDNLTKYTDKNLTEDILLQFRRAPDADQILAKTREDTRVLMSGINIRGAYLLDLTGDGLPEICATVTTEGYTEDGYPDYRTTVQVYDYAADRLYHLENDSKDSLLLAQRDGWLFVLRKDASEWYTTEFGQLMLTNAGGGTGRRLEMVPLTESQNYLTRTPVCLDVFNRKRVCLSAEQELQEGLGLLHDLKGNVSPAPASAVSEVKQDDFGTRYLKVSYMLGEKYLYFSQDYSLLWDKESDTSWYVDNPEPLKAFSQRVTDGVLRRETSGEAFASLDAPWDWFAGLKPEMISSAKAYVCLSVTSYGNTTSVSNTSGPISAATLGRLVTLLNGLTEKNFTGTNTLFLSDSLMRTGNFQEFFSHLPQSGSATVSLLDPVNNLAAILRWKNDKLEILVTDETEQVEDVMAPYLKSATLYTMDAPELEAFMKEVVAHPPVITYTVGAEYNWQPPITLTCGDMTAHLRLIDGWEYERYEEADHVGIRCRPAGITEGWLCFTIWPEGYYPQETDRYYAELSVYGYPVVVSWPAEVSTPSSFNSAGKAWSFRRTIADSGHFAVINEGADSWFRIYDDQISDIITLTEIATFQKTP